MIPAPGDEEPPYRAPGPQLATWAVLGATVLLAVGSFAIRGPLGPDATRDYPSRTLPAEPAPVLLQRPEMEDEYWPCTDCHEDAPTNRVVRELEDDHDEMEFLHGTLWCLRCHDADERDSLRLANGELIGFDDSWRLCTQCHGKKLADWRAGVHGKRTGHWWGPKEYRTCVACHNPHLPPFKPLEPKPAPLRPGRFARDGDAAVEAQHE